MYSFGDRYAVLGLFQHCADHLPDALLGVELAAALIFRACEPSEEVIMLSEHVLGLGHRFVENDVALDVHSFAEADFVEAGWA